MDWAGDIRYLEQLGFSVVQYGWYEASWILTPDGAPILRYVLRDDLSANQFEAAAVASSGSAELHGIFHWGHGHYLGYAHFSGVGYTSLATQLRYKLGLVVLNACYSNHFPGAGGSLVSQHGIFEGHMDICVPSSQRSLLPSPPEWVARWWVKKREGVPKHSFGISYSKPMNEIIQPGDQGTRN